MKITKNRLEEIIKEEISKKLSEASLEDLEARMSAMDTRRSDDDRKVKHRGARDELIEIARALQLMFDLSGAVVRKKSEDFSNITVYGLSIREQGPLKELADIVRQYAKHVKDAETETEPISEGRGYSHLGELNNEVERILNKVNSLGDEPVDGATRGGPYTKMPVDMYIDGVDNYDEARKTLRAHALQLRLAITHDLGRPVPQAIRDRLSNEVKSGFLSKAWGMERTR